MYLFVLHMFPSLIVFFEVSLYFIYENGYTYIFPSYLYYSFQEIRKNTKNKITKKNM